MGSCSTTRMLQDGQSMLSKNKIKITNSRSFNSNQLNSYIKHKPANWSPMLYIYNWQNGKGGKWDKLMQKMGTPPVVYDSTLVSSSIDNLVKRLEYLGYYNSTIKTNTKIRKKKAEVSYIVTLGDRYVIDDLKINVPEGEFKDTFLKDTSKMLVKKGEFLSEAVLEAESVRSSAMMRNNGYYGFTKNYYFFEADTLDTPGKARLMMDVREYTRNQTPEDSRPHRKFYINDVTITIPENLNIKESTIRDLNRLYPGEIYSEEQVNLTYSRLSSLSLFSGVNLEMTQAGDSLVDCRINISQSKLQGFKINAEASVNSTGLFGISPQISYFHKNIFKGGERLNLNFMGNFQFKPKDKIKSDEFGVSAGINFPRFLLLPQWVFKKSSPRTDVNLSYNYQDRPEYTRNIISASFGYQGNLWSKLYYQIYPVNLNIVRLLNIQESFYESLKDDPFMRNAYQNHFDLGVGGLVQYTTNSEIVPQDSYYYAKMQVDIAGNLLSAFKPLMPKDANGSGMIWNTPFSQFVRAEITLGRTWVFGNRNDHSIATRFQAGAGLAYGNSTVLPFEKHFYAGGANSMRGWQARTLGPGMSQRDTTFVIPNQTGDMKLEANIEYRFPISGKFGGALFIDAGNIWNLKESGHPEGDSSSIFRWDTFGESIAINWGFGFRLNLGFLLLRLDTGFKLRDPSLEGSKWRGIEKWGGDGFATHFGVGYPF